MRINDISQNYYANITRDFKKNRPAKENAGHTAKAETRQEQAWIQSPPQISAVGISRVKKENSFINIVRDAVNLSPVSLDSLINEMAGDESGVDIDVEDLEFYLDMFIEMSGREVKNKTELWTRQGSPF